MPAVLTRAHRWTRKPPPGVPLDPAHPLGRYGATFWLFNENGGTVAREAGAAKRAASLDIGVYWDTGPDGAALRHDPTGTGRFSAVRVDLGAYTTLLSGSAPFTLAARVWLPSLTPSSGDGSPVIASSPATGGIEWRVNTDGTMMLIKQGVAVVATSTGTVAAGVWTDAGVTYAADGTCRFYLAGQDAGGGTSVQTFDASGNLYVGWGTIDDATAIGAKTGHVYVAPRVLAPAEMALLARAPFDALVPRPFLVAVPAGAAQALAGQSDGASTAAATTLAVARPLAGSAAGTSTAAGTLPLTAALAGSAAGTSTATGTLAVTTALAASSAGASTAAGDLAIAHTLAGQTDGASTAAADLAVAHSLAGAAAGDSSAAGSLTATYALAGTSAGDSTATGDLSLAGSIDLAATAAGTSTVTGSLSAAHSLAAQADGTSTAAGTLGLALPLAGAAAGTSSADGTLGVTRGLAGSSASTATVAGALSVGLALAGSSSGAATAAGLVTVAWALAGAPVSTSAITGVLSVSGPNVVVPGPGTIVAGDVLAFSVRGGDIPAGSVVGGDVA